MKPKPKATKRPRRWAAHVVDSMSDEEVRQWCQRLGIRPPPDSRTPLEQLALQPRPKAKP